MRNESSSSARRAGRVAGLAIALVIGLLSLGVPAGAAGLGPVQGGALPGPLPVFPSDNWWNADVSGAPVDPGSPAFITFIGSTRRLHPDLGGTVSPGSADTYGMPYVVVDGTQPKVIVDFVDYGDESDGVGVPFYPIPTQAITQPHWVEGGDPGNVDLRSDQDRHLLIVDRDNKLLYELYNVFYDATKGRWQAGSGAFFDMKTNNRRPEGWTSADAAGLAIFPGLVRYDEVYDSNVAEIQHAFRVTVRSTNGHVYPASHTAGSTKGALPMGARLRLKASKDISGFTPEVQKIFRAMKRYGLIVADNGSDMYIGGTFDTRWNNDVLNPAFGALTAADFEVVQLGWKPAPPTTAALASLGVSPGSVVGGQSATGTVTLSGPAPAGGAAVILASANPAVVVVPASVTVAAGATSATFSAATTAVTASTIVGITASYAGVAKSAALTANPPVTPPPPPPPPPAPVLSGLSLNPNSVVGGARSTGTVALSGPAPAGGVVVSLSSAKPSVASAPASVTVPAGKSTASFTVSTRTPSTRTTVTISASLAGTTKAATLTVRRR